MKIKNILILVLVFLTLVIVVLGSSVNYLLSKDIVQNRVLNQLESISTIKENQLNHFIEHLESNIEEIANDDSFSELYFNFYNSDFTDKKYKEELLDKLYFYNSIFKIESFTEIFVIDLNGQVVISTDSLEESKIKSQMDYFIYGKSKTYTQSYYYSLTHQTPSSIIATPIKNEKDEVIGVLATRVNIDTITEIMSELSGLGSTGETYLVDKHNLFVSKSRLIKNIEYKRTIHTSTISDCLAGNNGEGLYKDYRDANVIGNYKWLPKMNVCLLTEINESEILKPIHEMLIYFIFYSILIFIFVIVLVIFISHIITNPIKHIVEKINLITKGQLDVKLEKSNITEIESLIDSLNRILVSMKLSILKKNKDKDESNGMLTKEESELEDMKKFNSKEKSPKISRSDKKTIKEKNKKYNEEITKKHKKIEITKHKKTNKKIISKKKSVRNNSNKINSKKATKKGSSGTSKNVNKRKTKK